ncbi:MAG: hypothetical protein JW866_10235 [Ignavibacteriales bacterium]|nr:hypothetical protein [Ignavibacteriales bacterium]
MSVYKFSNIEINKISCALPPEGHKITNEKADVSFVYRTRQEQTAADLGFIAARKILESTNLDSEDVGVLIFCTATPDYPIPSTAFVLQSRLGLSLDCLVYDINISESGFIYGVQVISSLLNSINKSYALLIVGDTMTKLINSKGLINYTLFSDGAAAILFKKNQNSEEMKLKTFSDGRHFKTEIVPYGCFRHPISYSVNKNFLTEDLILHEEEFNEFFTEQISEAVEKYLQESNQTIDNYDYFSFSQSSRKLLNQIARQLNIPETKLLNSIEFFGNSGIASIPVSISSNLDLFEDKTHRILACGFGAGLSWGLIDFALSKNSIMDVSFSDDFYPDGDIDLKSIVK